MAAFLARPGSRAEPRRRAGDAVQRWWRRPARRAARTRLEAAQLLGSCPTRSTASCASCCEDDGLGGGARRRFARSGARRKRSLIPRVVERLARAGAHGRWRSRCSPGWAMRSSAHCATTWSTRRRPSRFGARFPPRCRPSARPAAQFVLLESVLDSDTVLRHRVITALNKLGQVHPERRVDRRLIETVLGAEIIGHYRSYQVLGTLGALAARRVRSGRPGASRSRWSRRAERIFRLLKILYPEHDMHSAYVGLQSDDPVVHDNAMEFLENDPVAAAARALLVPLFDRGVSPNSGRASGQRPARRAHSATRDEAIAVMMQQPGSVAAIVRRVHHRRVPSGAVRRRLDQWARTPIRCCAPPRWPPATS